MPDHAAHDPLSSRRTRTSGHPAAAAALREPRPQPPQPPQPVQVVPASDWSRPCLEGLDGLSASELRAALRRARHLATLTDDQCATLLHARTVANLFFEDSTRTRVAFTVAAQKLGARVIDLAAAGSSVSKGESIFDTVANVHAMGVNAVVVRHRASGAPGVVRRALAGLRAGTRGPACAVLNAGDGRHEHPTQGLLDAYTVAEAFGRLDSFDLAGIRLAIVGDVASSRVARSAIFAFTTLGAEVVCVGPPALAPASLRTLGAQVCHSLDGVIGGETPGWGGQTPDAVMMLRIQFERHADDSNGAASISSPAAASAIGSGKRSVSIASVREYAALFGLSQERADRLKPGAVVLHPGPVNRGVEIASTVADGQRSLILRQVSNGVFVRMAALDLCVKAAEGRLREGN